MDTTRRQFIQTSAAAAVTPKPTTELDALQIARKHHFSSTLPTPNFFEGMLLGNGDVGLCITTRPDGLGLHLGKLDSWDIRVSEDHIQHLLGWDDLMALWKRAGDEAKRQGKPEMTFLENNIPEYLEYQKKMRSSYDKPWPRPWPCGIVWLHWDSRFVTLVKQQLDISTGLFTLQLRYEPDQTETELRCYVHWDANLIVMESSGDAPFVSAAYAPWVDAQAKMPPPELTATATAFKAKQVFPAIAPTEATPAPGPSKDDSWFELKASFSEGWNAKVVGQRMEVSSPGRKPFRLEMTLLTPRDQYVKPSKLSADGWKQFWSASAVALNDAALEKLWYQNQYLLACTLKAGKVCPGLFGNWMSGKIGTSWHGDYHMNYNTQQVFWGVFSSNHVDMHIPYLELVEKLMPMALNNAKRQFGLPGAYFPHSAYPVPSLVNPYPVPPWGYEICETPWTVQSLWWHYLYTKDEALLRRIYPPMKAAGDFLLAFGKKGADGKWHIAPSVAPELWGSTVDFRLNRDCIIDLALTEFLMQALIEASRILNVDEALRPNWRDMAENMAPYPTKDGVWIDVVDAPAETVYNVPVTLSPVFPAEQVGFDKRPELMPVALKTARLVRLEGGNDLVWQPLTRARLGMLDLNWFKRQVAYCQLPNGLANDRVRQIGGRYRDSTDSDFMMRMGVWTENLSLPAVLNECMLQSHAGVIRLFPNTKNLGPAKFRSLRAAGAFLISAEWDGRAVVKAEAVSEKGGTLRYADPRTPAKIMTIDTKPGGRYNLLS